MTETIIFAHRGLPVKFAENSLEGFRYAATHGAEGVELDVHLTKDKVPVVMHDEEIDRTTDDGSGYIKDYTLSEIRKFHLKNGEPVPMLRELFEILQDKDLYINLEFKTNKVHDKGIEAIVLALAKEYHFVHPIIFSSFNYQTLKNCQRVDPHQQYCFLTKVPILFPQRFVRKNHFAAIHPHWYLPSKITQRIWTVDNPKLAKRYFKRGVAGIFTNNFELMNRVKRKMFVNTK
ncbi:glycerophosphodiester phosphodiesterase family protein [Lactobacillus helveticus]|uniref:Glycerophosphodiester phosphodiesterase n=1 Tax=Lactobacillus helveticus TaxID=1587 RepID=A0A9Q5CB42_LACHE|nr:glycerophosphodiester phosphodiesterase family protein [Lactobacillus helveticus]NRN94417.1 Glycerophosphodiester phosphodiesterase [Lactobacillus helveticus]NRO23113.1 Glycerophosphodiester phosphodiesterase [Lactobacillus helveticus]NRO31744.1 Glycerophosphodiester phosphodiesterase [Lactobacillus helveticus]NRO35511.1 Glycerophosphodiester phosphodiesterase [Lactobacillus helveticus]NRO45399.1 Glycerophosphodiester phosphodiesterase [Lactobacillus helveticus]